MAATLVNQVNPVGMISFLYFATCTSHKMHLVCPWKFYISIVSRFSWNGCNTQEKWKTKLMQNLRGCGEGKQGVLWEMCKWRIINFLLFQEISIAAGHVTETDL